MKDKRYHTNIFLNCCQYRPLSVGRQRSHKPHKLSVPLHFSFTYRLPILFNDYNVLLCDKVSDQEITSFVKEKYLPFGKSCK